MRGNRPGLGISIHAPMTPPDCGSANTLAGEGGVFHNIISILSIVSRASVITRRGPGYNNLAFLTAGLGGQVGYIIGRNGLAHNSFKSFIISLIGFRNIIVTINYYIDIMTPRGTSPIDVGHIAARSRYRRIYTYRIKQGSAAIRITLIEFYKCSSISPKPKIISGSHR